MSRYEFKLFLLSMLLGVVLACLFTLLIGLAFGEVHL